MGIHNEKHATTTGAGLYAYDADWRRLVWYRLGTLPAKGGRLVALYLAGAPTPVAVEPLVGEVIPGDELAWAFRRLWDVAILPAPCADGEIMLLFHRGFEYLG